MDNLEELRFEPYLISGLSRLNIIVGKNGSGKSRFLREFVKYYTQFREGFNVSYISPERGGSFLQNPSLELNITMNKDWFGDKRRHNQDDGFKSGSAYLLRQLELIFLRKVDRNTNIRGDFNITFSNIYLDKINKLLSNISIEQNDLPGAGFIFRSSDGEIVKPADLSSGESEVIALASEVMHFFATIDTNKYNLLIIDEPDVHQHPDLQGRFSRLLIEQIEQLGVPELHATYVVIATHSSSMICDLSNSSYTSIGTKHFGLNQVEQRPVDLALRRAAPFFAHPLSLSISKDPIFIIEGVDDESV